MPLLPESRRAWRRQVAAHLVRKVDEHGRVRLVGHTMETRRDMLKVARLFPSDVITEIFADPRYPARTYMEISLAPLPTDLEPSFRLVRPDRAAG